jgi:hypothetical protein
MVHQKNDSKNVAAILFLSSSNPSSGEHCMIPSDGQSHIQKAAFDPAALLMRACNGSFCRSLVQELSCDLPADDLLIAEWLTFALKERDDNLFKTLICSALAAGRSIDAHFLTDGALLLPDPDILGAIAAHCSGDVASALIETSMRKCLDWERDAVALLMAGLWCSRQKTVTYPPELISRMRMLVRESRESFFAQMPLLALSTLTGSFEIQSLFPNEGKEFMQIAETLKCGYESLFTRDILDSIPLEPEYPEILGKTIKRSVQHIGRNEPCPCGSGKKYKKCCYEKDQNRLRRSSDIAGVTIDEQRANPETFLTDDRLMQMRSYELSRLNPEKVPSKLHQTLLNRLLTFGEFDAIIEFFETVGITGELEYCWEEAVQYATIDCRKDVVLALLRLNGIINTDQLKSFPSLGFAHYLILTDEKPCHILQKIEDHSREAAEGKKKHAEEELAYALFEGGYPGLGIIAARAAIPLARDPLTTTVLLDKICQARDELGFAPDEPYEQIIEELSGRFVPDDDQNEEELAKSRDELDRKNAEIRQLRQEIEKIHKELNRRETMLASKVQDCQPEIKVVQPAPPDPLIVDLQDRVVLLKSELKQRHNEKNQLRRELESTQSDLQKLKQKQISENMHPEDQSENSDENVLLEDAPFHVQAIRVPVFSERFKRSIVTYSKPIAAATMRLIGRLAAGDATAFAGSKRLLTNHSIMRQRIGIKYRLLFSLKDTSLEIIDLIDRKDLEKTLRNFQIHQHFDA